MYLKRLEIYGFKTFAQRTVFEFRPGVTAVVGPNGSGKSNVADALRWVLGEQSFANLRSKRTDDLIFGGGKGRAPMGFAEVFLTIDNSDRLLPLPYDEVTIGRRAYRSGESEYSINRARVRLRDVADAVAPLGSSYTLINQGLVDSALALHPEERRRLFEDAAEIGPYQAKKAEAERRLRETEANLLRLNDLVSEIEPQLRTLKRQARDAEAVGAVEAELQGLLRQFYAAQWTALTERVAAAEAEVQRLAAAQAEAGQRRTQAAAQLQATREQLRAQRAAMDELRGAVVALRRDLDDNGRSLAVAAERLTGLGRRATDLARRDEQLATSITGAQAQAAQLEAQLATARAELAERTRELSAAEAAAERVSAERRAAEAALTARREQLAQAGAALETARSRSLDLERRRAALGAAADDTTATIRRGQERRGQLGADMERARTAVVGAEETLGTITRRQETLRLELEGLRAERARRDEQITAARRAHGELQARYDALSRLARSYEGTFAGVRAAMQWAERERRPGFVLVSALLRAPAELETAVEVALGSRLQQIVVDRWSDAEAAIAQLKRANAGRATFLPLDTLRVGRRLTVPALSGIRGIAADLVEVDEHYAPIRAYLLGRTLIADDLPAARRAVGELEGGWTIVTLGGEQIATGGAVTGGAATKEAGILRRERELRDLPGKLAAALAVVEEHQAAHRDLSSRADALQAQQRDAEAELRAARQERDRLAREADTQQREYHRAEDQLAGLERRRAELTAEQETLANELRQRAAAVAKAEAVRAAAADEVAAAEAALGAQETLAGVDDVALRGLRGAVSRLDADLRTLGAELRREQQQAETRAAERRSLAEQQRQLAIEQAAVETEVVGWQQAREGLDVALAEQTAALAQAQTALTAQERAVEALETDERAVTEQLLRLEGRHAEAAVALQRYSSERDALWERAAEDGIDVESLPAPDPATDEPVDANLHSRIEQLRGRIRRMGPVNALAPDEYAAAQTRHTFLTEQLADVRAATASLREAIGTLDQVMQDHFTTTFAAVAREFSRAFTQLFGGGSAKLVLMEEADGAAGHGIEIVAQPPGKRQLNLQLLSGGERALTAAALLFAILTVNPSPFVMLDEVDAALDEANVVRFREALLALAEQTQFILVTHNRGTVEAANTLYGITMAPDGSSRVLSLRLEEIDESLELRT